MTKMNNSIFLANAGWEYIGEGLTAERVRNSPAPYFMERNSRHNFVAINKTRGTAGRKI